MDVFDDGGRGFNLLLLFIFLYWSLFRSRFRSAFKVDNGFWTADVALIIFEATKS